MLKNNCTFQVRYYDDDDVGTAMTTKYSCYCYCYGYCYYHCRDGCCFDVENISHFCCYKNVTFQSW